MHKPLGVFAILMLTACVSSSGQPKAYQPAPLGRPLVTSVPKSTSSIRTITFDRQVAEGFQFLYQYVNETEFVLCLEGRRTGANVHVTGFRLARMKETSAYKVAYEECGNSDYVGTAHNHPMSGSGGPLCYQSAADQRSFQADGRAIIDVILCGDTKFLWVLKDGRSRLEGETTRT